MAAAAVVRGVSILVGNKRQYFYFSSCIFNKHTCSHAFVTCVRACICKTGSDEGVRDAAAGEPFGAYVICYQSRLWTIEMPVCVCVCVCVSVCVCVCVCARARVRVVYETGYENVYETSERHVHMYTRQVKGQACGRAKTVQQLIQQPERAAQTTHKRESPRPDFERL